MALHAVKAIVFLSALLSMGPLVLEAQDPLVLLPKNYRLQFENDSVSVIRVHYGPHQKLPVHDHSTNPTIYVYLSDSGPVRFSHVESHTFTLVRQPLRMGSFRVSPGRLEKHEVENQADVATDFLRVELKTIPLGSVLSSFRDRGPFDLTKTKNSVAYDSSLLTVRRIIVSAGSGRQHYTGAKAGLVVAFSPAFVGRDGKRLESGDVWWAPDHFDVEPEAAGAHLLWVVLK